MADSKFLLSWLCQKPAQNTPKTAVKRTKTEEEKRQNQLEYESKRVREFRPAWQQEFPWILYDNQKMYCQICRASYGHLTPTRIRQSAIPNVYVKYAGGPLVTGCNNFKHYTLAMHNESEGHKIAEEKLARTMTQQMRISRIWETFEMFTLV